MDNYIMGARVRHSFITGAAANPAVLVDGPKWDADHEIEGVSLVFSARSDLSLASANDGDIAYASDLKASYKFASLSSATVNGWTVLASSNPAGRWLIDSDSMTLPILGGTLDDWPNFGTANAACAASGVTLCLGAGTYNAKSRQFIASNAHIVLDSSTWIKAAITIADNRDSVFDAYGTTIGTTTLAAHTNIGDQTIVVAGLTWAVGDYLLLNSKQFRCAMYEVIAYDAGTKTITLDRPIRMAYGSALATTSFRSGSAVWKIKPPKNVLIECNGAKITGNCDRYFEFYLAWKCQVYGPVYCGDGTTVTAQSRFFSWDEASYDCHAYQIYGDGGDRTDHGMSFESTENCTFNYCDMRQVEAGVIFQDAINSGVIQSSAHLCTGFGAVFTAADAGAEPDSGTVWGSNGCYIDGGSWNGNYQGITFEKGSSFCSVRGTAEVYNCITAVYDHLGNYNSAGAEVNIRGNANGVYLDSTSVGFRSDARITNNNAGIQIISGASSNIIGRMPFGNVSDIVGIPSRLMMANALSISDTTSSVDTTSGALTVAGGLGVAGNISGTTATLLGQLTVQVPDTYGALISGLTKGVRINSSTTGSEIAGTDATGSVSFQPLALNAAALDFKISGTVSASLGAASFTVPMTTVSTSVTTGAVIVGGGLGVAGKGYFGSLNTNGNLVVAGSSDFAGAMVVHAQFTSAVADGTYAALFTGTTKAFRFTTSSTEAQLSATDVTGSGSYQPLSINGSQLNLQTAGGVRATVTSTGIAVVGLLSAGGSILSTSPTAGVGYATGAGGTVTQATSKSTGVTLSKTTGTITLNAASLAAASSVAFTLTNTAIAATDLIIVNIKSGATANSYSVNVDSVSAGSCSISLRNYTAGALAEAVVLSFAVIKGVSS